MKLYLAIACVVLAGPLCAQTLTNSPQRSATVGDATHETVSVTGGRVDPAKEAAIRRLLDLSGAKSAMTQLMTGMEQSLRPLLANSLPPGDYREKLVNLFFEKFHSRVDLQQLLDIAVPFYDKYYSRDEIEGLVKFYETPLGQKLATTLPKLSFDLQQQGEKWGEQLGRDSMLEVLAEHPELKKAMEDSRGFQMPK